MQGFLLPAWSVNAVVQATALLALAGLSAWLLRSASAAARRLLWLCALAVLPALPLLSLVPSPAPRVFATPLVADPAVTVVPPQPAAPEAPAAALVPEHGHDPSASVPWAALLWAGGAGLCLARWSLAWRRVRRMARAARAVADGPLIAALSDAAEAVGIRHPVRLLLASDDSCAPMTWGWHRPTILLPARAREWSAETARVALLHEAAHIHSGDWAAQALAASVCALYWFHPLAWYAARRLRAESERACDDAVLNAGIPAPAYADLLLSEARRLRQSAPATAVAMARPSGLESRLRAILDASRNRRPLARRAALGLAVAAILALLPLALLQPAGATVTGSLPATSGKELVNRLTDTTQKRRAAEIDRDTLRRMLDFYNKEIAQMEKTAQGKGRAADFARGYLPIVSNRKQWVIHRLTGAKKLAADLATEEQDLRQRIVTTLDAGLSVKEKAETSHHDVEGAGVVVTLRDAPADVVKAKTKATGAHYDPGEYIIRDVDVWRTVNVLRAAGARVIAINGERLTERSAIVGDGARLRVNGHELKVPLRIEAVGEPEAIAAALQKPGGMLDPKTSTLAFMQMATLEQVPHLRLPAE